MVVGHSQGEIAAACVAGALTVRDAARVVVTRSRALAAIAGRGGMVSLWIDEDAVPALVRPWAGRITVAAVNGPGAVVVAGEDQALDELIAHCTSEGVRARRVAVAYASHTPQVEPLRTELTAALAGIATRSASIPMRSTVTGQLIEGTELGAAYWFTNLCEPVRFGSVVGSLVEAGHRAFVEVSPHPILTTALTATLETRPDGGVAVGTLRREQNGLRQFLRSLTELHVRGLPVDWAGFFADTGARSVSLPTYAFQRDRYWMTAGNESDVAASGLTPTGHPLLGAAVSVAGTGAVVFAGRLAVGNAGCPAAGIVPASVLIEMAIRAADDVDCTVLD